MTDLTQALTMLAMGFREHHGGPHILLAYRGEIELLIAGIRERDAEIARLRMANVCLAEQLHRAMSEWPEPPKETKP